MEKDDDKNMLQGRLCEIDQGDATPKVTGDRLNILRKIHD